MTAPESTGNLLIRNVRISGRSDDELLIVDGRIASIGRGLPDSGGRVLDGRGGIILPAFVDAHAHVDKTTWGLPYRPNSAGPTLADLTQNERQCRGLLGQNVEERAFALLSSYVQDGTGYVRTHVDVDTEAGLSSVEGVVAAARRLAGQIYVEVVAFPQSGMLVRPGTVELLDRAIASGASVIGGIDPAGFDRDPVGHLDAVFDIAERRGVAVDIHLHDRGELGAWEIELIAERVRSLGMGGRATISHAFALAGVPERRQAELADLLASDRIAIATVAPGGESMIPLRLLVEHGVQVCIGNDGVRDLWSPFGTGDLLEKAKTVAERCGFRREEDLQLVLQLATYGGAGVLGLSDYGMTVGSIANLVVVDGETIGDAVVRHEPRVAVIAKGNAIV